jgi:membrane-associated phospholipid phosphatase
MVTVVVLLGITYFGNQIYFELTGKPGEDLSYIFYEFNQLVPFIPATIYPYVLAYPFWAGTFIYVSYRSQHNMHTLLVLVVITFLICGFTYFFFQSDVQTWRETSGLFDRSDHTFTESIVFWIYNAAGPRNANPSMHTLMSWLCILGARLDKTMPKTVKAFIWVMALAIIIATQTLKQHYIIDVITAVAIAEGFYWLIKDSRAVTVSKQFFDRLNRRFNLDG